MTPQEAIERLSTYQWWDMSPEEIRRDADSTLLAVLRSNGLSEVADAWDACRERVGLWYA